MVIGNGVGNRAGFVRFEQPLQSVVLTANLVFGHPNPFFAASRPVTEFELLACSSSSDGKPGFKRRAGDIHSQALPG